MSVRHSGLALLCAIAIGMLTACAGRSTPPLAAKPDAAVAAPTSSAQPTATLRAATATPPPSPTTAPTDPPTAAPSATPVVAKVTALKDANVRSGPSTQTALAGTLKIGQEIVVDGKTSAGDWLHLASGGWVRNDLVSKPSAALPVVTPASPPTATPQPAVPSKGLGISRASVQAVYEKPEVGYTFERSSDVDGQPRVMGSSRDLMGLVELIGPANNLVYASSSATLIHGGDERDLANMMGAVGLLKVIFPDWTGLVDWVSAGLKQVQNGGEVHTDREGLRVTLQYTPDLLSLMIIVEPKP